jgi:transposase InsO family protein
MELSTRLVVIASIAPDPNGAWMAQVAQNLTDCLAGFLSGKRHLIHDRAPLFTAGFTETLKSAGVRCVKLPPKSPNLNAYAERFVRSIKSECLDRMIFFGGEHLRHAINEYVEHYHAERNHQEIGNKLIERSEDHSANVGSVLLRTRLGGMLKYYHRAAA